MSKGSIVALGIVGVLVVGMIMVVSYVIGVLNQETSIRVTIENKQKDNSSQFDNLYKKISQVAQVSQKSMDSLKEIVCGYAQSRTGEGKGGSVMSWITESVPNVSLDTFKNLQNIITGSRDAFTMRQTELLDLNREHEKLIRTIPSSIVCSMFGRNAIDITIVTSTKTEETFKTGKDDDVSVFPVKK